MRRHLKFIAVSLLGAWCVVARAAPADGIEVRVCFNYGCAQRAIARIDASTLRTVADELGRARNAAEERDRIAHVVARIYVAAGTQTPIWRDRGNNLNDDLEAGGAMDCIDHSTNTTEFLRLMERQGMLRFHRVGERIWRMLFFMDEHWGARVIESASGEQYVVDSWVFDLGTPAVVMSAKAWKNGAAPVRVPVQLR